MYVHTFSSATAAPSHFLRRIQNTLMPLGWTLTDTTDMFHVVSRGELAPDAAALVEAIGTGRPADTTEPPFTATPGAVQSLDASVVDVGPLTHFASPQSSSAVAIAHAVGLLKTGDTLIVAGKGHEEGQTAGGVTRPFSDLAEVKKALEGRAS
eukprot:TRINITY_DN4682_c0_g1_i2.p1 TRINITY_DN4682_c0_g1~~TRINITY_DN4682_c0_g1_i2.p1  ORF type:complete len:153 (+),score=29.45 TRINITY_DN4682_c0_g1_i2:353-811(+)